MKKILGPALFILLIVVTMVSAQVELKSAQIEPAVAAPGDSVSVRVEFTGGPEEVKSVTVLVREYPYEGPRFTLKQTPGQSIWSLKTVVPWDAPIQTFHLDFGAIDKNDTEIVTSGYENNETGKTGSLTFEVK